MDSPSVKTDAPITDTVTKILNNDYVFALLAIAAFAYGQRAGPKLPQWLIDVFSKDIVRVLFLSLLLVIRFESRPTVALIIAVMFVYILQYIYIEQFQENFTSDIAKKLKKLKEKSQKELNELKDKRKEGLGSVKEKLKKLSEKNQKELNEIKDKSKERLDSVKEKLKNRSKIDQIDDDMDQAVSTVKKTTQ